MALGLVTVGHSWFGSLVSVQMGSAPRSGKTGLLIRSALQRGVGTVPGNSLQEVLSVPQCLVINACPV